MHHIAALGSHLLGRAHVERRQSKVMRSATRTNAIVSSLFPENVRDRLLEDQEREIQRQEAHGRMTSFMSAGAREGTKAFGSDGEDSTTSATIFGSRPIADLFPETTIMCKLAESLDCFESP